MRFWVANRSVQEQATQNTPFNNPVNKDTRTKPLAIKELARKPHPKIPEYVSLKYFLHANSDNGNKERDDRPHYPSEM